MPNAIRIDSMPITFNTGEGNSSQNPEYGKDALAEVLAQSGCVSVSYVNAIVTDPAQGGDVQATLGVGVDANGALLQAGDHLAALPCPLWCPDHR
jgi:hypothetical protein